MLLSLEAKAHEIESHYNQFTSWEDKYREMIAQGKRLPVLAEEFKVDSYKINGCQSQVWLYPSFNEGKLYFNADSDSLLVKGIIALLVEVYSGFSPEEILSYRGDFLKNIGITQHLSLNRSNGLTSMLKQIELYAQAFLRIQKLKG